MEKEARVERADRVLGVIRERQEKVERQMVLRGLEGRRGMVRKVDSSVNVYRRGKSRVFVHTVFDGDTLSATARRRRLSGTTGVELRVERTRWRELRLLRVTRLGWIILG